MSVTWRDSLSIGIFAGLVIGKPLGIFLFSALGVLTRICVLRNDFRWKELLVDGFLGGAGFTDVNIYYPFSHLMMFSLLTPPKLLFCFPHYWPGRLDSSGLKLF